MMRKSLSFLALLAFLVGCGCSARYPQPRISGLTSGELGAIARYGSGVDGYVNTDNTTVRIPKRFTYNPVEVLDSPDVTYKIELEKCFSPIVLREFASSVVSLRELLRYIRGYGIRVDVVEFEGANVNVEQKVSMTFPEGATLCDVARVVSTQTTTHMYVDNGNVVTISPYARRTFRLPMSIGVLSSEASIDEQNKGGGGGSGSDAASSSSGGLGMTLGVKQQTTISEIEENIKKILGGGSLGKYVLSQQYGVITVYAPPQQMRLIEDYINGISSEMSRTAKVYVTVLNIRDDNSKDHDFDWAMALRRSLIEKPWKYGLTSRYFDWVFSSPSPSEEVVSRNYGFGVSSIESPNSHKFIIRMLQSKTDTTVLESTSFVLANGKPVLVTRGQSREYIKEINRSVSDQDVNFDVKKGVIHSGLRIYASGSVRDDSVTMSLLVQLQDLVNMETLNVGNTFTIQNPTVDEKRQGLVLHLGNNETEVVVGGTGDRTDTTKSSPGLLPLDLFSTSANHNKSRSYVLILVTPQIIKNDRGGSFHEVL